MNLAWSQSWLDEFTNVDAMMDFYNETVDFEDLTLGLVFTHRDEVRTFFATFGLPGAGRHSFTAHRYIGTENEGTIDWTWHADHEGDFMGHPAAGKHTEIRGVSVMTFSGGKIRSQFDLWDSGAGYKQLGVA